MIDKQALADSTVSSEITQPTYHVVLRAGGKDSYDVVTGDGELRIGLASDGAAGHPNWQVQCDVSEVLASYALVPATAAVDFFRIACAAYSADLRVPRATAFDGWSRDIVIHVPVMDPVAWKSAADPLHRLLAFLTGDRWAVEFRSTSAPLSSTAVPKSRQRRAASRRDPSVPFEADAAALFSGGLDSGIGAIDTIVAGRRLALVGHNSKGGDAFSSPAQDRVLRVLHAKYGANRAHQFRFRVDPPPIVEGVSARETTTRSRSIIFLALGLLVASGLDEGGIAPGAPLIIPENGLISLNVPLNAARLGSWSTRTTHGHTLDLLRQVLERVGIPTLLETPYRFVTKGEMLAQTADAEAAREVVAASVSCGHPNQGRYVDRSRVVRPDGTRRSHCGTCVPCIIRRASTHHVGWDDPTDYWFRLPDELNMLKPDRASDARAFIYALSGRRPARVTEILRSGPQPISDGNELRQLLRVYDAGMDEVARLLGVTPAIGPV